MFWFSLQRWSKTFLTLRRIRPDIVINVKTFRDILPVCVLCMCYHLYGYGSTVCLAVMHVLFAILSQIYWTCGCYPCVINNMITYICCLHVFCVGGKKEYVCSNPQLHESSYLQLLHNLTYVTEARIGQFSCNKTGVKNSCILKNNILVEFS